MVKVWIWQKGRPMSEALDVEARFAHVRDGCLVYATLTAPDTEVYRPTDGLVEFTIDRTDENRPVVPPLAGSGVTAIFDRRPPVAPGRKLEGLVDKAKGRTDPP